MLECTSKVVFAGWTAYTGGRIDPPAWVIGYLLFLWQIPHFLALSYYTAEVYQS
jgi:heme O synthase-like polyprenyltransferase